MNKKYIFTLLTVIMCISLCSCTASRNGNTLTAFTERMNKMGASYSLDVNGYIYNEDEKTFSRFYIFDKNEIMLQFTCNDTNDLYAMDLVFEKGCIEIPRELKFINDCISCYINDTETEKDLFSKLNYTDALKNTSYETKKAESGDIEMMLDVTAEGTVITVTRKN